MAERRYVVCDLCFQPSLEPVVQSRIVVIDGQEMTLDVCQEHVDWLDRIKSNFVESREG